MRPSRALLPVAVLAVFAGARCSGGESDDDPDAGEDGEMSADLDGSGTWVRIGGGATAFVPIEPGARVEIIAGPQGGYHIWGGFEGAGFDPQDLTIEFQVVVDGSAVGGATYIDTPVAEDGLFRYAGVAAVLYTVEPTEIDGEAVVFALRLRDRSDRVLYDSVEIRPVCCAF